MALFRDDRQEDWRAIIFSILIIAFIVVTTMQ
jgi:hypothetical protein